jgi:2,4-dienoyl-CoA reductase-like NADH-dependent reductase (Old Yellow Enzyme family)
MKWFKHNTTTRSDEKIARLFDRLGVEGYGVFWSILEEIARNLEGSSPTFLQFSAKNWGKTCGISAGKFRKFAEVLKEIGIFFVEFSGNEIKIDCPNILKYRDEWNNRKNKTPELLPSGSGQTTPRIDKNRTEEKRIEKESDPADLATAEEIFSLIVQLNPAHKKPNIEKWAYEVRLMRERDGRTVEQILDLFRWANRDSFWKSNIISPSKLRDKWDALTLRRATDRPKQNNLDERQAASQVMLAQLIEEAKANEAEEVKK